MDRTIGKELLHNKFKKNGLTIERRIFFLTKEKDFNYQDIVYEILGIEEEDDALERIKNRQICWKNPIYDDITKKIEEIDDYLVKPFDVVDGVVECGKCGSKKTWSIQKQTRSSDEPMTTFSRCVACGHKWSYSG
jgi:DNA-directed RNA polymerase subunit M/transcription elongation factor TFIIS